MNWYIAAFKKYVEFSGRATRSEYWFFMLFYFLWMVFAAFIDAAMGGSGYGTASLVVVLVHLLPGIAVSARRLHDIGKTGWWLLLNFIPLIGPLVLFIFAVLDSDDDNIYGPNPKAA